MSAQTRNDSRYERQAHAHVFSSRPHHERKASHLISCGGIVPVWGSSPPKQELFHRNFGATRQSGGAGHVPESVSRFGASEWDTISAIAINRKLQPVLSPYSGMHFPPRASNGNCSPQFGRKVGCSFPGLDKERRSARLLPQQGLLGRDGQRANLVAGGVRHGRGHGGERRVDDDLAD